MHDEESSRSKAVELGMSVLQMDELKVSAAAVQLVENLLDEALSIAARVENVAIPDEYYAVPVFAVCYTFVEPTILGERAGLVRLERLHFFEDYAEHAPDIWSELVRENLLRQLSLGLVLASHFPEQTFQRGVDTRYYGHVARGACRGLQKLATYSGSRIDANWYEGAEEYIPEISVVLAYMKHDTTLERLKQAQQLPHSMTVKEIAALVTRSIN
jgi:hypothetical protein